MSDFDALMATGMAAVTAVLGEPLTVDGQPRTGVVNTFYISRSMAAAGFDPGYSLTVAFSWAQIPAIPPVDVRPVFATYLGTNPAFAPYRGKQLQVAKEMSVDSAGITIHLQEVR